MDRALKLTLFKIGFEVTVLTVLPTFASKHVILTSFVRENL